MPRSRRTGSDGWWRPRSGGRAAERAGSPGRPMMAAIEGSRQRLQMDCVDIYYLHQPDPETEIDETLETLGELIAGGKVRHFGISNFAGWEMADMVHRCRRLGVPQPGRLPALLQHPEPGRRSRDLSRRPPFRDRRGGLQPARRRLAERQVPWRGGEGRTRIERRHPLLRGRVSRRLVRCRRGASRITPKDEAWPLPTSRPAGPSTTPT